MATTIFAPTADDANDRIRFQINRKMEMDHDGAGASLTSIDDHGGGAVLAGYLGTKGTWARHTRLRIDSRNISSRFPPRCSRCSYDSCSANHPVAVCRVIQATEGAARQLDVAPSKWRTSPCQIKINRFRCHRNAASQRLSAGLMQVCHTPIDRQPRTRIRTQLE